MKRTFLSLVLTVILVISAIPVFAVSSGTGVGINITPEQFPPRIWMCDSRAVTEDCVESGKTSDCSQKLTERIENYAFEGEQIHWRVLVMDKNKIEQIQDVVGTVGSAQGVGNPVEVECKRSSNPSETIPASCNARIDEQDLTGTPFNPDVQAFYDCTLTVETPDSMHGQFFLTVEAQSSDGQSATMKENEFWFLNPVVAVSIDGTPSFNDVRPGAVSYSDTLLVGNDADQGSGVLMDMFVSGTDFYDSASEGAKCPTSNRLKLAQDARSTARLGAGIIPRANINTNKCNANVGNSFADGGSSVTGLNADNADHICYFATNGAYSTQSDPRADPQGYVPIVYGDKFTRDFYNDAEILMEKNFVGTLIIGGQNYDQGNVLSPGAEIAMTFKLAMPEPCNGNFDLGQINFWGEAI